jgi:hypothetical protein
VREIACGSTLRKKLDASEVPAVIPANLPAVEITGKPDATPAAPAAVEKPNVFFAHVLICLTISSEGSGAFFGAIG